MKITLCVLLFLTAVLLPRGQNVRGARILGVYPFWPKSHHTVFQGVLNTLAKAGHEVVVYTPYPLENHHPNYRNVFLNVKTGIENLTNFFVEITQTPYYTCVDQIYQNSILVIKEALENKILVDLFKSNEHFDAVFTEFTLGHEVFHLLGHKFNAPVISVQAYPMNGLMNAVMGNSLSLSFIPDICTPMSDRMSFTERLLNSYFVLRGIYYIYYHKCVSLLEEQLRPHFPDMPSGGDLAHSVDLVFVNDHPTVDYPQPRTPNIIPVGGIHIGDVEPLPANMKQFMDEATDGVILFTLGTYTPDNLRPKEYFDMHIKVFRQLRQRVLWKTKKDDVEGLPENVMTAKWVPQKDILAHPKCVLFITHAGLLSTHEAVHFGVPVVVISQFFDQHRNAKLLQERGVGVHLQLVDLSEKTLQTAIQTVLDDPRYRDNMRRLSRIFRDRPLSPAETVVIWTEHVLRHGAAPLRPASTLLSWYQLLSAIVCSQVPRQHAETVAHIQRSPSVAHRDSRVLDRARVETRGCTPEACLHSALLVPAGSIGRHIFSS